MIESFTHRLLGTHSIEGERFKEPLEVESNFLSKANLSIDIVDHRLDSYYSTPQILGALKAASARKNVEINIFTGGTNKHILEAFAKLEIKITHYELPVEPVEHYSIVDDRDELREFPHPRSVDICKVTIYKNSGRIPLRQLEIQVLKEIGKETRIGE